jgi:hypothetical protein
MVKRSLLDCIATDDPNLWIRLADGKDNLPAHRGILEVACSCVNAPSRNGGLGPQRRERRR